MIELYGFTLIPANKALKICCGYMKLLDGDIENYYFINIKSVGILRYHIKWSSYFDCYTLEYDYNEGGGSGRNLKILDDIEVAFLEPFRCHHLGMPQRVKQLTLFDFI